MYMHFSSRKMVYVAHGCGGSLYHDGTVKRGLSWSVMCPRPRVYLMPFRQHMNDESIIVVYYKFIVKIQDSRLFIVIHLSPGIYIQSTLWHHENYFDHAIIVRKKTYYDIMTQEPVLQNTLSQQHWTGQRSTDRLWPLPWPALQTYQEDSDIEYKKGFTWYCQRFSKREITWQALAKVIPVPRGW